ncbi:MAG: aminopeptidase P family N-terminal domain-containing protein [Treponema sp.]|nr:aminopeptidase P family N-terminal domain-containing protein [Treponema sp.]
MKQYTRDELNKIYETRREKLISYMTENKITAAIFEDCEERRNPAVRYFTGHPTDALFIITDTGKCALIPWDENLAKERAVGVNILPYNKYERRNVRAVKEVLKSFRLKSNRLKVELPPSTPYPLFLQYVDALEGWDVLCRENSTHDYVVSLRSTKDEYEIECTKEACRVGDWIISEIERGIR